MKVAIHAHRHWAIGRRWRAFAAFLLEKGHEVYGFSTKLHDSAEFVAATFRDCGIENVIMPGDTKAQLDDLQPDLICGQGYMPPEVIGRKMVKWGEANNVPTFLHHHFLYPLAGLYQNFWNCKTAHIFACNQQNRNRCAAGKIFFDIERIHTFGTPEHDLYYGAEQACPYPPGSSKRVHEIHESLNLLPDERLIALFPGEEQAIEEWEDIFKEAHKRKWRVLVHPHPMFRKNPSGSSVRDAYLATPEYWDQVCKMAYGHGAIICVDYLPGVLHGTPTELYRSYEMIAAADVVVTDSYDVMHEAYVLSKRAYFYTWSAVRRVSSLDRGIIEPQPNGSVECILRGLEERPALVQDPLIIKDRFEVLDGRWSQRAYSLWLDLLDK